MKSYRVQASNMNGYVRRGWGMGRVASWGPWVTIARDVNEAAAREHYEKAKAVSGLRRVRLVFGAQTVEKHQP